jgi:hypothetical protein
MTDEKGYNGWKNYETWAVALWIDNEQSSYNYARELLSCGDDYEVVEALKDWIEDMNPLVDTATVFTDLLNAALSEVDWYEIVKIMRSE